MFLFESVAAHTFFTKERKDLAFSLNTKMSDEVIGMLWALDGDSINE